ncbi:MAG TPA: hypothetical protein VKW04_04995 [Planctomycetota bacterium]|nr:hypothetical protein [Planctomycetota bacterium]
MGSISSQSVPLESAARLSKRIVIGTVLEKPAFHFPGSREHQPLPEGKGLHAIRIRVKKTLKGPDSLDGKDLWVFRPMEWFQHTHADVIQAGVISYEDLRLAGALPQDQILSGKNILFFLNEDPPPTGFPPGTVFLGIGEGHLRADQELFVVRALRQGPNVDFGHFIRLEGKTRVRFPDLLEIGFLGHSHKRSRVEGPHREWIEIELSKDGERATLSLTHDTAVDSKESWATKSWGVYTIEVKSMWLNGGTIVVRKVAPH